MFSGCSSLTSIDLTFLNLNGNNYLASMFFNCSKLETIKLNANLYYYGLPVRTCLKCQNRLNC